MPDIGGSMADIFENLKKVLAHGFQYAVNQLLIVRVSTSKVTPTFITLRPQAMMRYDFSNSRITIATKFVFL